MSSEDPVGTEEVLWKGRVSHWFYLGYWLAGLLLAAGAGVAVYLNQESLAPWLPWVDLTPVVVLIVLLSVIAWKRALRRYQITSSRVVVQTGRFVTDSNEIRTQDIRSINVMKNGLSGLLGIGTVEFSSAATDDADVTFVGIAGADGVRDLVRKLQSTA
jgi:membrane protein YdbS with pleckstrin-like domain